MQIFFIICFIQPAQLRICDFRKVSGLKSQNITSFAYVYSYYLCTLNYIYKKRYVGLTKCESNYNSFKYFLYEQSIPQQKNA